MADKRYNTGYYELNREKILERVHERLAKFENRWLSAFRARRSTAKAEGIPWNIELSDLEIPERCPILGIPLNTSDVEAKEPGSKYRYRHDAPTIDRIVPELGYIKGNVRVISRRANTMKQDASREELELFARNILKYLEKA